MNNQKQQLDQLKYALWLAIMQNKNEQIVQFFNSPKIEINVNVNLTNQGITALHQAASNGNLNLVQFLVAIQKADIDQQDLVICNGKISLEELRFILHVQLAILQQLIIQFNQRPKLIFKQLKGGESPIMKAAQFHQSQLLIYLIQTHSDKINWNLVNKLGHNVLHIFRISSVNSLEKQTQIYTPINDVIIELMALISVEGQQTVQ
ncbi:unnamed protein product [Paramecium primaurelia]|uniref:Ankyrin repeat-containing protein n=1 Tax=Paramecium primaurelia TaxID=5886 RepID=A0A8S1QK92_PARPR|nr:unnamed protein product [Paramecium primaurelia]